jgi:hypothetical protein
MNPEKNPIRVEKRFFPRRKVRSTVKVPKRAAGNLTGNELNPCQRRVERAMSQKKRGGLSGYIFPLKCMRIQSPSSTISLATWA